MILRQSGKGRSVVVYKAISQDYLNSCTPCKVLLVQDRLEQYDLYGMIGEGSKPPDHSIVALILQTLCYNDTDQVNDNPRVYNLKNDIDLITFRKISQLGPLACST